MIVCPICDSHNPFLPGDSPRGRKFRSQTEVRRYLEQTGSRLSPHLFCFNPYGQAGLASPRRRLQPTTATDSGNMLVNRTGSAARTGEPGGTGGGGTAVTLTAGPQTDGEGFVRVRTGTARPQNRAWNSRTEDVGKPVSMCLQSTRDPLRLDFPPPTGSWGFVWLLLIEEKKNSEARQK